MIWVYIAAYLFFVGLFFHLWKGKNDLGATFCVAFFWPLLLPLIIGEKFAHLFKRDGS